MDSDSILSLLYQPRYRLITYTSLDKVSSLNHYHLKSWFCFKLELFASGSFNSWNYGRKSGAKVVNIPEWLCSCQDQQNPNHFLSLGLVVMMIFGTEFLPFHFYSSLSFSPGFHTDVYLLTACPSLTILLAKWERAHRFTRWQNEGKGALNKVSFIYPISSPLTDKKLGEKVNPRFSQNGPDRAVIGSESGMKAKEYNGFFFQREKR